MQKNIDAFSLKEDLPTAESFYQLYATTGWNTNNRSEADLHQAISNSWYTLSAYLENTLIGFGRIISDGSLHAFIVDLIISPTFQNKGLGANILKRLVDRAVNNGIIDIQLFCAQGKKEFYLKNGFDERSSDSPGMQWNITERK